MLLRAGIALLVQHKQPWQALETEGLASVKCRTQSQIANDCPAPLHQRSRVRLQWWQVLTTRPLSC